MSSLWNIDNRGKISAVANKSLCCVWHRTDGQWSFHLRRLVPDSSPLVNLQGTLMKACPSIRSCQADQRSQQ